jgi:hypothetical protein
MVFDGTGYCLVRKPILGRKIFHFTPWLRNSYCHYQYKHYTGENMFASKYHIYKQLCLFRRANGILPILYKYASFFYANVPG